MAGAEDPTALAAKIGEAILLVQAPGTAPDVRRTANEFILQVRDHPSMVGAALQLCVPQAPPMARFFAFQLLAGAAECGKLRADDAQVAQVRALLFEMLSESKLASSGDLQEVPAFVREKYTQALAAVAVYGSEWPAGWPDLHQRIFAAGQRSRIHAMLTLTFFRNISEVLQSDAAARLPVQRRKGLQAHLKEICAAELFRFLATAVVSLFPGFPELDRTAVLLVKELSSVVPVRTFLAADIDAFLRQKLSDPGVRGEVVQAFTEWLSKDVAKDLKDAPERMGQLVTVVCELAGNCQATGGVTAEDYEVHKSVAMLLRDFVEANKPSVERRPELQAILYRAAVSLLRYPSFCVQFEALSVLPYVLRAALPEPKKTGGGRAEAPVPAPPPTPPWLRVKEELMAPLLLCAFRQVPSAFDLFPLPPGYFQAMQATCELDAEEDLSTLQTAIRGRLRECLAALAPSPDAALAALAFLHELLPRALGAGAGASPAPIAGADSAAFLTFEACLILLECAIANIRASSGPQALEATRALLSAVLRAPAPGPEREAKRVEFLGRVGGALDACAEVTQGAESPELVLLFNHLFQIVEHGGPELRKKALTSCVAVSKAAPKAIRPVLQALVDKAAGLLQSISDEQHSLCEALVAASTAAQNFAQQQALIQNLLGPLVSQWVPLAESLSAPETLVAGLLGDRSQLDVAHRLLLCFWACFRASTVPSRPDIVASGGFAAPPAAPGAGAAAPGVAVRNPAAGIAAAVLPGLARLFRAFHAAFPSDGQRAPSGAAGGAAAERLKSYIHFLDKEELKNLTSSLDTKRNDEADSWDAALPPPGGEDAAFVLQGRQLLFGLRNGLYKCLGAALGVQDGVATHAELNSMLSGAFLESFEGLHPYHVELQLRNIWLIPFSPSGMASSTEGLRTAFAVAVLPKLLPMAARSLDESWRRLQRPDAEIGVAGGSPVLLWALCTGTIMASRTYVELVVSLVLHGGTPPALFSGAAKDAIAAGAAGAGGAQPMERAATGKKKGKDRTGGGDNRQMRDSDAAAGGGGGGGGTADGGVKAGWAGAVFTTAELTEAVQGALCASIRWQDAKGLGHALLGAQSFAVRLLSGGETHSVLKDCHAASPEATQRSGFALRGVLQPIAALCRQPPPAPPGDGALHTVIGKPFFDFFAPEKSQGKASPSQFAVGVTNALFPILSAMCQIFSQVCKAHQVKADIQQIVHFPPLVEAGRVLATLPRTDEAAVRNLVATLLDDGADAKMKRGALRGLVVHSVDPDPAALAGLGP